MKPTAIALGYFDGVHIGHQKVIHTAKEIAQKNGWQSAVMTFDPHPAVVLGHMDEIPPITPLAVKEKEIEALGIDVMYIVRFTKEFSQLSPQEFIDHYIIDLAVKHVVAGFDYTYGRFGKGTMETIGTYSRGKFESTVIEKVEKDEMKISSSLIRKKIQEGSVESLPEYLGRYYQIEGTVITGDKRGRTIGFPTANISPSFLYLLPKKGVYAVRLKWKDIWYNGILNLGYVPTFYEHLSEPTIEVHLLDFDEDIYGEHVTLEWRKWLRDEKKFASVDDLVKQLNEDKKRGIEYFQFAI